MIDLSDARRVFPSDSWSSTFRNQFFWGVWHKTKDRAAMAQQLPPEDGNLSHSYDSFRYVVTVIDSIGHDATGAERQTPPRVLAEIDKNTGGDLEAWRVMGDFLGFGLGFEDSRRYREISRRANLPDAHAAAVSVELLAELVAELAARAGVEVEWFQFKQGGYRPGLRSVCAAGTWDVVQLDAHVRARDVYGNKGES